MEHPNHAGTALDHAYTALSQLVEQEDKGEPKLGLSDCGKITIDIIDGALRSKSNRNACIFIAEQAYQLVNAVDAGIKGGALDTNNVVREHVARLNNDLDQIRKTIKRLGSWWTFPPVWNAQRELSRCRDILEHGMDTYILLLKGSLAQTDERQDAVHTTSVDIPAVGAGFSAASDRPSAQI